MFFTSSLITMIYNRSLFGYKLTLYRFNQGAHTIAGGSNWSMGAEPPDPVTLTTAYLRPNGLTESEQIRYANTWGLERDFRGSATPPFKEADPACPNFKIFCMHAHSTRNSKQTLHGDQTYETIQLHGRTRYRTDGN